MGTQNNLEKLKFFFLQKGINKSGICSEAGISQQYLNRILKETQPLTSTFEKKILPVLKKYGFK